MSVVRDRGQEQHPAVPGGFRRWPDRDGRLHAAAWQQVAAVTVPGPRARLPDPPKVAPSKEARRAGRQLIKAYSLLATAFVASLVAIRLTAVPGISNAAMAAAAIAFGIVALVLGTAAGPVIKRTSNRAAVNGAG